MLAPTGWRVHSYVERVPRRRGHWRCGSLEGQRTGIPLRQQQRHSRRRSDIHNPPRPDARHSCTGRNEYPNGHRTGQSRGNPTSGTGVDDGSGSVSAICRANPISASPNVGARALSGSHDATHSPSASCSTRIINRIGVTACPSRVASRYRHDADTVKPRPHYQMGQGGARMGR